MTTGPSGWLKVGQRGKPATYPIKVVTGTNYKGEEGPIVIDADGDEVYGGTWGDLTQSSPFPHGTVPAGEATIQDVYNLLVRVAQKLNTT